MSDATASRLSAPSLSSIRVDLQSDDQRRRLAAISELSRLIDESKTNQYTVGAFLRDGAAGRRLLEVVFADLQVNDRTLRCAVARLICQLAYENLVNQEMIVQCTRNGFSHGWIHIFSVPPAFHAAYETQGDWRTQQSQRGLAAFLQQIVSDAYNEIYEQVGLYYANGCQLFLPICWQFPRSGSEHDGVSDSNVPDPAEHVLGFYLVPRQTQFPEHDDVYHDDLLKSLDKNDLHRLQGAKHAYENYITTRRESDGVGDFVSFISARGPEEQASLRWLLDEPSPFVASLCEYAGHASAESTLTWNNIFVYASVQLNTEKLADTFDRTTLLSVEKLFQQLAFTPGERVSSATYVWLPVLVASIQRDPDLPGPFKKLIQSLQRGVPYLAHHEQPWQVLLGMKLDQVVPVSWAVFLGQWRIATELDAQLRLQQQAAIAPVRRTSVCSVGDLRRSVVSQLQSQSVRNLSHLEREQPKASRFASQQDLTNSSLPLPAFRERTVQSNRKTGDSNDDDSDDEERDDPVAYNMALFHRMQRSLAELDELGMKNLQDKRNEKQRILDTVAMNKQRAQDEETRKRLQVDGKHREIEEIRAGLERRKAEASAKAHEQQQSKHALAAQRKQQRDAELEEKQQELAQKIMERDRVLEQNLRRLRRQQQTQNRPLRQEDTVKQVLPRPPSTTSKRPLSARGPRPVAPKNATEKPSPEILRQRALLYGQVVSKIYIADALLHRSTQETEERAIHQPHQLTRSFSVFQNGSFNVKAPVVKVTAPPPRRSRSPRHRRPQHSRADSPDVETAVEQEDPENEDDGDAQQSPSRRARKTMNASSPDKSQRDASRFECAADPGHAASNACATLVMRNAALAVSERILIPEIPAPHVEEPSVPPYVIAAQYEALDDQYKRNFRERFNLKCVSHRLSYDVLKQYTKIVRRDMAWRAFHDKCSGSLERVKYMDFAGIAQSLGVLLSEKRLLVVARQLDPKKSGYVEWKAFYTWWIMQYSDTAVSTPTRPKTSR